MKTTIRLALSLLLGIIFVCGIQAQGAPAQIDIALNDLSNRTGQLVGIGNLSDWRWSQATYPNTALGCDGVQGTGSDIAAYQFTLTYQGITYDYRVSADNTIVVLCGQLDPNQPTPVVTDDEPYSNRLCLESEGDLPYMRTRINVGMDVEVTEGVLNLRAQPSSNAEVLMQIPGDLLFRVEGGPSCVDNFVWWYVNVNGQLGYIAEGQDGSYFIEPQDPEPLLSREIINPSNLANLEEFSSVSGNFIPHISWSPDGLRMTLPGARGSDSIWVYRMDTVTPLLDIIETDESMTTIEFHANGNQAMFGTEDGTIHLWQIIPDPNTNILETLFLNTHQSEITSIAFSPDGARFVSAGQNALTNANVDRTWAAIVWDVGTVAQLAVLAGHEGLIRDISWSPDGTSIVTVADDGLVKFWDATLGVEVATIDLESSMTTVAHSPNGQFVAVGLAESDGRVILLDAATQTEVSVYQVTSAGISSLAFSPDSNLLTVGGSDNTFAVWNTQTDQPLTAMSVDDTVRDVSFSPDGSLIVIATDKPSLLFYGVPLTSG